MIKLIIVISLIVFSFTTSLPQLFAQEINETEKKLQDIRSQISDLQRQIEEAKDKEKTLESQISVIDNQTRITELKIDETNTQIAKLEHEIFDLSGRITKLSLTVDTMTELLLNRIVQTYKYGNVSTIDLMFSSHGFSDLILRSKYIEVAQAHDKRVLYDLQATKATYNDQKEDKQTRQFQQQKLKKDLEGYQTQLVEQRVAKEELLRVTQNDEKRFQDLIAKLRADEESITSALANIGVKIGPVEKGQTIAAMGSTGCSTGPHLHFEVFENAKVAGGRATGDRVSPRSYIDTGRLGPPIRGYPDDTRVTTEYGEVYFLGTHTGLDIAPKVWEGTGRAILASEKGIAYAISSPCSRNISGGSSVGKGVVIDHENGTVTLYWHVL